MQISKINPTESGLVVSLNLREVLENRGIDRPTSAVLQSWGISPRSFSKLIRGQGSLSLDQAARIAHSLNVRIDDLIRIETAIVPNINTSKLLLKYA